MAVSVQSGDALSAEQIVTANANRFAKLEATLAAVRDFVERIESGKATPAEQELTRLGVARKVLELLGGAGKGWVSPDRINREIAQLQKDEFDPTWEQVVSILESMRDNT